MIYIAKKLHFPFEEKFEFHFYGPYSEELTLQLEFDSQTRLATIQGKPIELRDQNVVLVDGVDEATG